MKTTSANRQSAIANRQCTRRRRLQPEQPLLVLRMEEPIRVLSQEEAHRRFATLRETVAAAGKPREESTP